MPRPHTTTSPSVSSRLRPLWLLAAGAVVACANDERTPVRVDVGNLEAPRGGPARVGFFYLVQNHAATWATTDWDLPDVQQEFQKDVVVMAALGVTSIKLALSPLYAGMALAPGAGSIEPTAYAATKQNVPRVVAALAANGISTVLTFLTNEMQLRGANGSFNDPTVPNHFDIAYSAMGIPAGPEQMGRDLAAWETGILDAVAAAGLDGAIDYYNLATEVTYSFQRPGGVSWSDVSGPMVQALFGAVHVPPAKRAGDVLFASEAPRLAADVGAAGQSLAITEVHSYPAEGANPNVTEVVRQMRAGLPGAQVVIGEFGSALCKLGGDEAAQAASLLSVVEQADALGIDRVLNWGLWDYKDGQCGADGDRRWGMGYTRDRPRAALGIVVGRQSAVAGGNFEQGTSGFTGGGTSAQVSLTQAGGDAAQGAHYLRLRADAEGSYYACSPSFHASGNRAAVSAYVRSNAQTVDAQIVYRDGTGWSYSTGRSAISLPVTTPGWSWRNLQSLAGGQWHALPSGTQEAALCFVANAPPGTSSAAPLYLDLDAVAINARDGGATSSPPPPMPVPPPPSPPPPGSNGPQVTATGIGCADRTCIWIQGSNLGAVAQDSTVDVRLDCAAAPAESHFSDLARSAGLLTLQLTGAQTRAVATGAAPGALFVTVVRPTGSSPCLQVSR